MKHFFLFIIVWLYLVQANSQSAFQILYGTTEQYYHTQANDALQASNGDYVIAGNTHNYSASGNDAFLLRISSDGNLRWFKIYKVNVAGDYKESEFTAIRQTSDGGFILAGSAYGVFGHNDVYVLKTDNSGNILWHRVFGGIKEDAAKTIQQTSTGDYVVAGYTYSFGDTTQDFTNMYVLKLSSAGDLLWNYAYDGSIGNNDEALSVSEASDGNYIVCGKSTIGSATHIDAALLKLNAANGNVIWSKTIGGATSHETGYSIMESTDGGLVVAGKTNINSGPYPDCFLLKLNSTGDAIHWAKTYAFDATNSEAAYSFINTNDGGFALYGDIFYSSDAHRHELLIKTDNAGNTAWARQLGSGNNDYGRKILQSSDNGYLLSSFEIADFSFLGTTAHITKTDLNGVSGCNDNAIEITTAAPAFIVLSAVMTSDTVSSVAGTETVTVTDEALPVTTLCQSPPPAMKFLTFEGTNNNRKNILKWETKSEVISDYYKVEKSNDGINFSSIGKMNATYKTANQRPYKHIDDKNITGQIYYRIKAVHEKGKATYSKIIHIKAGTSNPISISNTERAGIFLVTSEGYNHPFAEYQVCNSLGIKVYEGRLENTYGKILKTIDLSFLSSGIYFVNFSPSDEISNQQIIVVP